MISKGLSKLKSIKIFCVLLMIIPMLAACSYMGVEGEPYTIYTPNRTPVYATRVLSELTAAQVKQLNDLATEQCPNAIKLREPTAKYNCHSYAWYSRTTDNVIYIEAPEQKKYWTDGSYRLIATGYNGAIPSSVVSYNDCKVDYTDDDHSAVKTSSTKFTSKWGPGGLYEHLPHDCPYESTTLKYYRR